MHSADGWRVVLEPVIACYWDTVKPLYNLANHEVGRD